MKYTDEQRLGKIQYYTKKLLEYINEKNVSREDVESDITIQWTITTPLYNIGEQAYNLSDEYREAHSDIPWAKISGLRHRLVHNYEDTNWSIICDIVFVVLPEFYNQLKTL